ncbi:hypothetical protein PS15m_006607 [Mucor circinelloides]
MQPFEIEKSETIGESFNYIMDHFPVIKEIELKDTRLLFFDANTAGKQLNKLKSSSCWIKPEALLQLSNCVSPIDNLIFFLMAMLNDTKSNEHLSIKMPQTIFGEIAILPGGAKKIIDHQASKTNY